MTTIMGESAFTRLVDTEIYFSCVEIIIIAAHMRNYIHEQFWNVFIFVHVCISIAFSYIFDDNRLNFQS